MNKNNFEKAKELEQTIKTFDYVLNIENNVFSFAKYVPCSRIESYYIHYDLPEEVVDACKKVIKQYADKYKTEFNALITEPQQVSTVELPQQLEVKQSKRWYDFILNIFQRS